MFEKEAEEWEKEITDNADVEIVMPTRKQSFQKGADFGYNKAKVEVEDSYRESLCNSELNLASVTEQLEELEKKNAELKERHTEILEAFVSASSGDDFEMAESAREKLE